MNLPALCLAYAGFASLSLAMERHWSDRFGREAQPGGWRVPLQLAGTGLLATSLWACLAQEGLGIGLVAWLGCLTTSGAALVLTLTYWPKAITVTGPLTLLGGLAIATRLPGL